MKRTNILIFILVVICIPLKQSCAQTSPCPTNNKQAEKKLKDYFSDEKHIQTLRDHHEMPISANAKDSLKSLSGRKNSEECRQLLSNLEWLKNEKQYSIYKVADHYFIVLYSITNEGKFKSNEIPIVNSKFEAIGSIIDI